MKVALVHDHLAQDGGAEGVLKIFQEIYPQAPIYTLVIDKTKANRFFLTKDIRTSFIQKLPLGVRKYRWFLPLMPQAIEKFNLMDYDIVLSNSSSLAKGVITSPKTLHICYCHTPTRFLWTDTHSYVQELSYPKLIKSFIFLYLTKLRVWDRIVADRVDIFIANSGVVQKRIKKYYRRESEIIYPPVGTKDFHIAKDIQNYYLTGGRLVAYKRFDLAIQAFNQLKLPLKVFGEGPEFKNLKRQAKSNIELLGRISDEKRNKLYSHCQAFINPQEEDFGITPIEAMAAGRPVLAYGAGGALETIIENKTGHFFYEQNWEALSDLVIRFKSNEFNPEEIRSQALQFDTEKFKIKIEEFIKQKWSEFSKNR